MFRVHFKQQAPTNYREAFMSSEENRQLGVMLDHLFAEGFMMINTCSATTSTAMGEAEIDLLIDAMEQGMQKVLATL